VALLRADLARLSAAEMLAEARYASDRLRDGAHHATAVLLVGAAKLLLGDSEAAAEAFASARAEAAGVHPLIEARSLASLALVQVEANAWAEGTSTAWAARNLLTEHRLEDHPSTALVPAMTYLVETRAGRSGRALHERALARHDLAHQRKLAPHAGVEARLVLAWADLLGAARPQARTLLDEAEQLLVGIVDAVRPKARLGELHAALAAAADGAGTATLTAAELRVLQCLPTHLTLAEIAQRLLVSRNTVKSQAIAIYRKLGTASRGRAVTVAREAGLLDAADTAFG
jgi:LuxR family maltose regulon positive regulatory protein